MTLEATQIPPVDQVSFKCISLSIGEEEIARFRGEPQAIQQAPCDVLQEVILAILWRRHRDDPRFVESFRLIDASLTRRSPT